MDAEKGLKGAPVGYTAEPAVQAGNAGPSADPAWSEALGLLYDEAKATIAAWVRDADRSARAILADAEAVRQQAHVEAGRVREDARREAGRILASAEAQAGQLRSQARLSGGQSRAEVAALRHRVDQMGGAVDHLLDSMQAVLGALARLSGAAVPIGADTDGLGWCEAVDDPRGHEAEPTGAGDPGRDAVPPVLEVEVGLADRSEAAAVSRGPDVVAQSREVLR